MQSELFSRLAHCLDHGVGCALATVVRVRGSAPGKVGARMLVLGPEEILGTVGGGAVEAEVIREACALIQSGGARILAYNLGRDLQMKCGGAVEIFLEAFVSPRLLLFGAGHVGHALYPLVQRLGFRVTVVDERPGLATAERFPGAHGLVHSFEPRAWAVPPPDAQTYCVVCTMDHATDGAVVTELMGHEPRYIGMIGSARKRATLERDLRGQGIAQQRIDRLHTPMGLPIGAETPEEIAVSIAAELVKERSAAAPPSGPVPQPTRSEKEMAGLLDTVLLLALPASGKSEVRTYLSSLTPKQCQEEFHMGPTVQLDDYPYVHLMRRIDEELQELGQEGIFFLAGDRPFRDGRDWGTLIKLLNEDYEDMRACRKVSPEDPAAYLFERLDRARAAVGAPQALADLDPEVRAALGQRLAAEAQKTVADKNAEIPDTLEGKTIVIEFARGGPDGSEMPLSGTNGYQYSLAQLSPEILSRSAILYVWVTPEESRRKNNARARPDGQGSILFHGTPLEVMMNDYGCDDVAHLLETSGKEGSIKVEVEGEAYYLPVARFDNRVDKTTFVRDDPENWSEEDKRALHEALAVSLGRLA